jgi:sialic acid synthase SpsE
MKILEIFSTAKKNIESIKYPYIIAEAGVNHEGKLELAKRLIDEAKEGGADAIKFQTYRADTITSKHAPYYWDITKEPIRSQYELFKRYDKFWKNEFEILKKYCDKAGIEFMSTPFDVESADFLNDLMEVYKISSSDITNKPFIEYICHFNKPIILSTGASNLDEITEAVIWIESKGNRLALLHCVLNYPTDEKNVNLGMIFGLRQQYPNTIIGYSDHSLPKDMKTLEVAALLGAQILEKHFTYDKTLQGNDHYHAMDKEDLKSFRRNLDRIYELMGSVNKHSLLSEEPARKNARRSLVAIKDIPKGKVIEYDDLTWKRPACGVSPKDIDKVVGRRALVNIKEDDIIRAEMIC